METQDLLQALRQRFQHVEMISKKRSQWFEIERIVLLSIEEAERLVSTEASLVQIITDRTRLMP